MLFVKTIWWNSPFFFVTLVGWRFSPELALKPYSQPASRCSGHNPVQGQQQLGTIYFPHNSKSTWSFLSEQRGIGELISGKTWRFPIPNQYLSFHLQVRHCLSFILESPPARLFYYHTFLGSTSCVVSPPHHSHTQTNKQKNQRSLPYILKVQKPKVCGVWKCVLGVGVCGFLIKKQTKHCWLLCNYD